MKKFLLISVTAILLLIGGSVIYLKYYGDDLVNKINPSQTSEKAQNSTQANEISKVEIIPQEEFMKSDLKYASKFLGYSVPNNIEESEVKVVIDSISYTENKMKIVLQQEQTCYEDQKIPQQAGFYYPSDNNLVLYNIVNDSAVDKGQKCAVKIEYSLDNLKIDKTKNVSIKWQTEKGEQATLPICFYNTKTYNNEDVFSGMNKCDTCTCIKGVVTCETNKKCLENEKKAAEEIKLKAQEIIIKTSDPIAGEKTL
jgi:hypothetical protein